MEPHHPLRHVANGQMVQRKGLPWLQQHIVNYADDNNLFWIGTSEQQLHQAVHEAAEVLEMLTSPGFTINLGKSVGHV